MQNLFLFLDIVSLELYTLGPAVFQLFYPLEKVGSLEALKILIDSGDGLLI